MSLFDADDYLQAPLGVDPPEPEPSGDAVAAVAGEVGADERAERAVEAAVAQAEMAPVDPEEPDDSVATAVLAAEPAGAASFEPPTPDEPPDDGPPTSVESPSDLTQRDRPPSNKPTDIPLVAGPVVNEAGPSAAPPGMAPIAGAPAAVQVIPEPDAVPVAVVPGGVDALWAGVRAQPGAVALLRTSAAAPVHAYLLVGPPGVGERALASAFAAALLCPRGGCAACDVCRRTLAGLHPDCVVVEREGPFISVDQAREIVRAASRSPVEGHRKVLVLTDFHLVTNAAPTLLKVIEEPPASTVFVVLAEHVPQELVTIASRCVQVRLDPLTPTVIAALLQDDGVAGEAARRAARLAGGSLDRARLLAEDADTGARLAFWESVPRRLDGTGAAVSVLAGETLALLDATAHGPLERRHRDEAAELEQRIETSGLRGAATARKELVERHRREAKRLRDDELRLGLAVIAGAYRDALAAPVGASVTDASAGGAATASASELIRALQELLQRASELERNPNAGLFLQALYLALAPLPAAAPAP